MRVLAIVGCGGPEAWRRGARLRGMWVGWAVPALMSVLAPPALATTPAPLAAPRPAPDQAESVWSQLRADDLRLARLVERLAEANVARCRRRMPGIGLVIHALDQYPPGQRAAAATLGFPAPLAIEAVVPGSAAERAGLRAGDGLVAVGGWSAPTDPLAAGPDTRRRDAALDRIEAAAPDGPMVLEVLRDGQRRSVTLAPRPSCRVRPELVADHGSIARADDDLLQIGAALLERFDDDGLVVVVAHELAHVVLRHGDRLVAAGAHRGLLGEFGRSARLAREAEDEADRFSVDLLAAAGFDPRLAVRFWQGAGRSLDAGLLRDSAHSSPKRRAQNIAAEIARRGRDSDAPAIP